MRYTCAGCNQVASGLLSLPPDWVRMTIEAGGQTEKILACSSCAVLVADLFTMTTNGLKRMSHRA